MKRYVQKIIKIHQLPVLACALTMVLTPGCMTRVSDCTVASTKNVKLSKLDLDALPRTKDVMGQSTQYRILLGIIPLSGAPNIKDALDDAFSKGDGDLMIDAVFYEGGWNLLLVSENVIQVKGEVVKTRNTN